VDEGPKLPKPENLPALHKLLDSIMLRAAVLVIALALVGRCGRSICLLCMCSSLLWVPSYPSTINYTLVDSEVLFVGGCFVLSCDWLCALLHPPAHTAATLCIPHPAPPLPSIFPRRFCLLANGLLPSYVTALLTLFFIVPYCGIPLPL
jgi:hypothetical protein